MNTSQPSEPLFSIITVCKNVEKTLPKTIASIQAQTFRDFEYLVVDGCSSDKTRDIIAAQGKVISHWVSEPDQGISDAFNKGIALARGRFVGILNADDWYEPNTLQLLEAAIRNADADIYCGLQRYWRGGKEVALFDADPRRLPRSMSVNHIASVCRRTLFAQHGEFRLDYHAAMDYELYLRYFVHGARFARVDAVLANMHLGGFSDREWQHSLREVYRAQRDNGFSWPWAMQNYLFLRCKGTVRRKLEQVGADRLVAFYRAYLAQVPRQQRH